MRSSFASRSLPVHLARGVIGFGSVIASVVLAPVIGVVSLVLLAVALLAFRGCPTCWTIGLIQTLSRGRLRRSCDGDRCRLETVASEQVAPKQHRFFGRS